MQLEFRGRSHLALHTELLELVSIAVLTLTSMNQSIWVIGDRKLSLAVWELSALQLVF